VTSAQHRPIALASDTLVTGVREATEQALRDWRARWPLAAALRDVRGTEGEVPARVGDGLEGLRIERATDPAALVWFPDDVARALGAAMFGASAGQSSGDGTAARAARAAAEALLDALAGAWRIAGWDGSPSKPPGPLSRWQAPVDVRLTVEDVEVVARVPAQRFAAAPRRTTSAVLAGRPASTAFAALPLQLEVVLGQAELSVVELAGLQRGDVVLLDASLHDPLPVSIAGAPAALHAWLGRAGQRRAVEFTQRPRS